MSVQKGSAYRTANQTKGEGKIYAKLLVQHWDLAAPLVLILRTCMRKAKLSGKLSIYLYIY